MSGSGWMLYGANGYTGVLIAEEARRRGLRPILAGRSEEKLRPLAERLGLNLRVFPLDDPARIGREIADVAAVLLAAGPFSRTSAPVVQSCLDQQKHYLDITGEIAVFEACRRRGPEAAGRGVVLLPGVGFDVVPSDCLAATLHRALPDALNLELAIAGGGGPSAGTAKTALEGVSQGGAIRKDGKLARVPPAALSAEIPFRDKTRHAISIPWGDLSTAFISTKIPNIVVYMAIRKHQAFWVRQSRFVAPALRLGALQRFLARRIENRVKGPDEHTLRTAKSQLWGRVTNAAGRSVSATLETPQGYLLTALTAVECAERLATSPPPAGMLTPSMAFGPDFIKEIPGCSLHILT